MAPVQSAWLSLRIELAHGQREQFWPRPGRIIAAHGSHTFGQLAAAIDTSFGRWDRLHLYRFDLSSGEVVGRTHPDDRAAGILNPDDTTLARLGFTEEFTYQFDHTERWTYLCTVGPARIDPSLDINSVPAPGPVPIWGWGTIPDQYGREWDSDDGTAFPPPRPASLALSPIPEK